MDYNDELDESMNDAGEGGMMPEGMGGDEEDDEDDSGKTATFPFMNRLFGGANPPANANPAGNSGEKSGSSDKKKGGSKKKFLDGYCINLTMRAREGKLDNMIGRKEELERVILPHPTVGEIIKECLM